MNLYTAKAIQSWSIDRLIPYARNARQHSDEQIAQVAASIHEFGFTNPILVDSEAGVIAGHARLAAAGRLGLTEVPVIVLDHLSDVQKRAYILVDNKLAENATWDEEMLRIEIEALTAADYDLSLTGFADAELDNLLNGIDDATIADEDDVPAVATRAVTVLGDVWALGPHRVICGDARTRSTYDTLLQGRNANMVFTDPPYNVDYESKSRRIANDNLGAGFEHFLQEVCSRLLDVCSGALYICMSSSELATLQRAFTGAGGHWSTFLIWAKNTFTLGRSDYQRQYEPILYGWKAGTPHYWCGARDQGDLWSVAKPAVNDLHPTMKPVELVERAIHNSSRRNDVVLDAFGGSGTTVIACERTDRIARVIEIEPKYVDVIVNRWQQYTGGAAVLEGTGKRFNEVADERSVADISIENAAGDCRKHDTLHA